MAKPHENAMDWSWWTPPIHHCSVCGIRTERPRIVVGSKGQPDMVYCALHVPRLLRESSADGARNPYHNFTLDHVRNENNEKITINSQSELRAAEKKYNFALAIASDDGGRADKPPQHLPWAGDVNHGKKRIWNRDPAAYINPGGITTGVAADPKRDTLIDRPNAT